MRVNRRRRPIRPEDEPNRQQNTAQVASEYKSIIDDLSLSSRTEITMKALRRIL